MCKKYCEYCGLPLADGCDCLVELAEYLEDRINELEERPETQLGWIQEDMIYLHRTEC
jgi:hypothetical protein